MTIGVQHRVEELADREEGFVPDNPIPFKRLIPLSELIASALRVENLHAQRVREEYDRLINKFGNEYAVLLDPPLESLLEVTHQRVAELIILNREGRLKIKPGFDGVYGKISFDEPQEKAVGVESLPRVGQQSLDSYFKR
ncbi:MAG: hypothetical protein QXW47_07590 [Candidatus Jordarchaeales archaeon]